VKGFKAEFAKINVFGTASKYKSVLIEIQSPPILDIEALNPQQLLGRTVYVNYPHTHEAKVVAISWFVICNNLFLHFFIFVL